MLKEGEKAPSFSLPDETGTKVSLADFAGKKVVVYFYPKDDTPGCTKEACSLRDNYDAILEKGAVVIGVSKDDGESHKKFKTKYDLPFYLVSDPDAEMIKAYGAWGKKSMYGKEYDGIMRYTYVIDESGTVIKAFEKVNTETHGEEILAVL